VPISKRKSGRGPVQRLSDQRRSLALAGLAVGAVFSAAVLRRKRRGEEAQLELASPSTMSPEEPAAAVQPEAPVVAAETGPPPAVEAPPAASEPEPDDDAPINAAPPAEPEPPAAPSSPVEPTTGELSTQEASILAVLAQSGRTDDDRTAIAVATSLERDTGEVTEVLRKLGAEGVVSGDPQTADGEEIWAVTERGVRRLGAQS
jgi:hypothetical protein